MFGLAGFLDATFLTVEHYTGGTIPCSFLNGCDTVTRSTYSIFAGLPVALYGAGFYLLVIILAILYFQTKQIKFVKIIWSLSLLAFLASLYFVYLQVFIIKALCLYCLTSALTATLIFVLASVFCRRARLHVGQA